MATSEHVPSQFYVALLHESMVDKTGREVTTSLTLIDIHDIARSCKTFGITRTFIAHPALKLRHLARSLHHHWEEGYGADYNPDRKEALESVDIVASLDEVLHKIEIDTGTLPVTFATSARVLPSSIPYGEFSKVVRESARPALLAFGTGWGMSPQLIDRFDFVLEPLHGLGSYNHLSVRSACAIILDRIVSRR